MEFLTTLLWILFALILIPIIILFNLADSFYKTFKKFITNV